MRVFLLLLFLCVVVNAENAKNIEKKIMAYFDSPITKSFYEKWKKFRNPIEHSIELILEETYGKDSMNVYVRKLSNPYKLSDGVLVSDNIVKVLLKDLYLTQMPHLTNPEVLFALAANVLQVEAKVDRMFIQADYQLFRNLSDVTYSTANLDPYQTSPFSLQQVKSNGEVTIVAEDCTLSGFLVATLHDHTVNLGHDTIKLTNCVFSVEISTPGLGSPPVIAPYFSKEQGNQLELLMVKPIRNELLPKLQGAVFTYVNTSSLFGDFLPKIREEQQHLFMATSYLLDDIARNANEITMDENNGIEKWKDVTIKWTDKNDRQIQDYKVVLKDMTITGLDSAYSAHNGGPHKIPAMEICDTVRFSSLQIRGSLYFSVGEAESKYIFYGEIQDITAHVSIRVDVRESDNKQVRNNLKTSKTVNQFEVSGWRNMDLHAPDLPLISPHSLITGIIINELPHLVIQRLSRSFVRAMGGDEKGGKNRKEKELKGNNPADGSETDDINERQDNENGDIENEMIVNIEHQDDKNYENGDTENEMLPNIEHQDDEENNESIETVENEMTDKMKHQDDEKNNYNDRKEQKNNIGKNMFVEHKNMFDKTMFDESMFKESMFGRGREQIILNRNDEITKLFLYDTIANLFCPTNTSVDIQYKVEFRLFTRDNKNQYILLDEKGKPVDRNKKVNLANAPLKVVTHGWISSANSSSVVLIKDAYLETRLLNIIAVDWSTMADSYYCVAVRSVHLVGKGISRFLEAVNKRYGVVGDDMHLIGHSLGAHVVGIAASLTTFRIGRATGLDPAGPCFEFPEFVTPDKRIDSSDANFVDIIHTCGGILGFVEAIGHTDFYPNSGVFLQPDCLDADNPITCSHAMSYVYYAKSIYSNELYPSWKCKSWNYFLLGQCDYKNTNYMGDGSVPRITGTCYLHAKNNNWWNFLLEKKIRR